ncbi:ABC transporter permease [Enterocloster bolteae]|uniref:ABC transporter permease n=1 Tax=Enterocloster bolteae TaxID=208479 RepID=UPI002676A8C8|nr:ABC transporter permease [Enterocloster bolteae]
MIYKKEICLELRKLRHRHTPALFLAVFALISAWMAWCFHDMDISRINDPAAMIYINMLLMNTILCPITAAVLASRMCDMEQIGDTYKWLCTMQKPEHIYRGKALVGTVYMAVFSLMETVLFHFLTAPFEPDGSSRLAVLYASLFFALFLTSLSIFIVQLNLSLKFSNQLTPIFISIGGTFTGLFSWFLHQLPLRFLIPWGYYAALCRTGYVYDEATRYTTCYWAPYPYLWTAVLAAAIAFLYYWGQKNFLKTVQETM